MLGLPLTVDVEKAVRGGREGHNIGKEGATGPDPVPWLALQ
jgi:hypothetical protein